MAKIDEIINGLAIECVCPTNLLPQTPTEKSMVRLFNEFGFKLVDRLIETKKMKKNYLTIDVNEYYKDEGDLAKKTVFK